MGKNVFTPKSSRGIALLILILVTLSVQLPAMLNVRTVEYDEAIFLDVAHNIQLVGAPIRSIGEQGVFFFDHTLLYVYLLSLYANPSSAGVFLARLTTALMSWGCIILAFSIGEQMSGSGAGLVSALLLALNPFFAVYSFFIRMEIPMVLSMLVGLFFIVRGEQKGQVGLLALAGLALAVAVLFKEFALLFTLTCAAYVLFRFWRVGCLAGRAVLAVTAPTAIGLMGWSIWCWQLSPAAFGAVLRRWVDSAAVGNSSDPRMLTSVGEWAFQITSDLLGIGIVASLVALAVWAVVRRKTQQPIQILLLGYVTAAVGISFFFRLKELRHLIGIIPMCALWIGTNVNWKMLLELARDNWLQRIIGAFVAVWLLLAASPLQVPLRNASQLQTWFKPFYSWRVFENDRYYNVLRLAGLYLLEHTLPNELVTVVHEATVTSFYADRHYYMLYTSSYERVLQILDHTRYLVWDNTVFPQLSSEQIKSVESYVRQHFVVEQVIQDAYRQVIIYRRINVH